MAIPPTDAEFVNAAKRLLVAKRDAISAIDMGASSSDWRKLDQSQRLLNAQTIKAYKLLLELTLKWHKFGSSAKV